MGSYGTALSYRQSCGQYHLSQDFSMSDLDIGMSPKSVYFTLSPALRNCDGSKEEGGLSAGAIVGIIFASLFAVGFLFCCMTRKSSSEQSLPRILIPSQARPAEPESQQPIVVEAQVMGDAGKAVDGARDAPVAVAVAEEHTVAVPVAR